MLLACRGGQALCAGGSGYWRASLDVNMHRNMDSCAWSGQQNVSAFRDWSGETPALNTHRHTHTQVIDVPPGFVCTVWGLSCLAVVLVESTLTATPCDALAHFYNLFSF